MVENKPLISRSHVFTGLLTPAGDTILWGDTTPVLGRIHSELLRLDLY